MKEFFKHPKVRGRIRNLFIGQLYIGIGFIFLGVGLIGSLLFPEALLFFSVGFGSMAGAFVSVGILRFLFY